MKCKNCIGKKGLMTWIQKGCDKECPNYIEPEKIRKLAKNF